MNILALLRIVRIYDKTFHCGNIWFSNSSLLPGVVYTVWTLVVYTIIQAIWKMIVSQNNIEMNPQVFVCSFSVTRWGFLTSWVNFSITLKTCFQFIIFYTLTLRSKFSCPGLLQTSFVCGARELHSEDLTLALVAGADLESLSPYGRVPIEHVSLTSQLMSYLLEFYRWRSQPYFRYTNIIWHHHTVCVEKKVLRREKGWEVSHFPPPIEIVTGIPLRRIMFRRRNSGKRQC